jgi:5-methylcytosine-specific restriction protein A
MAQRAARPCRQPGCPALIRTGARCPDHQRPEDLLREQRRGTSVQRGYSYRWQQVSAYVIRRDDGRCHYCGAEATTADHVIPKYRGGTDEPSNLVAACRPCNSAKGKR